MPYYRAGDYYRGGRGDYYRAGSIFSFIGNAIGSVARVAGSILPGPIGIAARAVGGLLSPARAASPVAIAPMTSSVGGFSAPQRPVPGIVGGVQRMLPGGQSGYMPRRKMNVGNMKALKRSERRLRGFEKAAKRALRPLGLHVVRHVGTCKHGKR